MKTIKLKQDACMEGYEGAFLNEIDESGNKLVSGIYDMWYTATAEDETGNEYTVYWDVLPEYREMDTNEWPDEDVCDWKNPFMVINENGENVAKEIEVVL